MKSINSSMTLEQLNAQFTRVRNEIKQQPQLLEDITYLFHNIEYLPNSLKKLPPSFLQNEVLMAEFLSKRRIDEKDYRYIPQTLLKNGFFLMRAMNYNPDLYFLADAAFKPHLFERLEKTASRSILKYASKEQLNDDAWVKEKIRSERSNFSYAPERIRAQAEVYNNLLYFSPEFVADLPQSVLDNEQTVNRIVFNINADTFAYLPDKYRNDVDFAQLAILKKNNNISHIGNELKKDDSFYQYFIDLYQTKKHQFLSNQFNFSTILLNLPEHFYTPDFCATHAKDIADNFPSYSASLRANLHVILAATASSSFLEAHYVSKINNLELRQEIKQLKRDKIINNSQHAQKYLQSYILKQHLTENMTQKDSVKRLKI